MKIIKKSNVTNNAIKIPSEAGDILNISMYMFIKKNFNTLNETEICVIQSKDKNGEIVQTEDIIMKESNTTVVEKYDVRLKQKVKDNITCIKELKSFLRNRRDELPVRFYYDNGYGWVKDEATGKIRFDGSSILGVGDVILDDHEHHLVKKGCKEKTIQICNKVMQDRVKSQFLIATSLSTTIFGALDLKSLIVNVCGRSSQGKSTVLKLCMGLWSNPDDENLSTTWYNTENAISARLNGLEGVPFLLDDTSQGNIKNFTNVVYNMEDGKSKGRLNKLFNVDNVAKWHTCILSGSENSMYDKTDEDKKGILRRLVEIDVEQGDLLKDETQAKEVSKIIKENYGHVGINFTESLFENGLIDNNFEKLNNYLEEEQSKLQSIVSSNGISRGLAEKLAVILLAAKLGKEYLSLEFNIEDLIEYVQQLILKSEINTKNAIVEKMDVDTCHRKVCEFADERLDDRFKTEFSYHIPVEYFNFIESKLGYKFMELRKEFRNNGICTFDTPYEDKGLDNTERIAPLEGGKKMTKKVITVSKMI